MAAIAEHRAMQQLHALADQHMSASFLSESQKLKHQLSWWRAEYRLRTISLATTILD
eukprot:COSAG01_NODE_1028_length_12028_cov_5.688826_11_plen_57_part_00